MDVFVAPAVEESREDLFGLPVEDPDALPPLPRDDDPPPPPLGLDRVGLRAGIGPPDPADERLESPPRSPWAVPDPMGAFCWDPMTAWA